ncbi:uncharacterized protein LOC134717984 [Mytilus trossulus]|uniref:uncharacterized protein LOC134717984 n=1 Tax=Mytilus trossulus TaxID=6551 RepID=UPI003005617E
MDDGLIKYRSGCIQTFDIFNGRWVDQIPAMMHKDIGKSYLLDDGLIKFLSGSIHTSKCNISTEVLPVIGKRSRDTTECSKCCNSSYCNLETCDKPYASRIKRCLSCKYALRPDECSESIQCSDGEVCYSQTLIHNSERRFRLGCIHRQQCGINAINQVSNVVQQPDGYCGQCCEGNNCNREICGQRKVQHYKLIKPPPLKFCRDNSTSTCAAKTRQCSKEYYKFFQCPYSCNQCGVFHYTESVTSTTAMPISSEKSGIYTGTNQHVNHYIHINMQLN